MIRITRTSFFFTGLVLIFLVYVAYKLSIVATFRAATGLVVDHDIRTGQTARGYPAYSVYAVVVFTANGREWQIRGGENVAMPKGEEVPVLYKPSNPATAYVYTFWSYWFHPILVLPVIALGALTIGIGKDGSYWTLYLRPFRISRTELQKRRDN